MSNPPSLYDQLRDRLVSGDFASGQRLRAEKLCADYECSASAMREVLFRLSSVGLVNFQQQRGFWMPQRTAARQHDLTRFRILLECEGACLSIRFGGIAWEARLSAAHHMLSHIELKVRDTGPSPSLLALWTKAELTFHQTLIDSCGSDVLMETHSVVYQQFRQQYIATDKGFEFVPENIIQHQRILDAALAHDEASLRSHIDEHLSRNLPPLD